MPDFRHLPLGQLTLYCPPLLQVVSAEERGAWRELQRRALAEQNPAAWDALMIRLWSSVLFWIYECTPEMAPAAAQRLAQQVIGEFQRRQMRRLNHADLLNHETLIAHLKQLIAQLLVNQ